MLSMSVQQVAVASLQQAKTCLAPMLHVHSSAPGMGLYQPTTSKCLPSRGARCCATTSL
jgi:hypothetical protein